MKVRVVVANENEARFLDAYGLAPPLRPVTTLEDSKARLHDRDLETDRPGRSFDRQGSSRHALDGERSSHRQEQVRFARCIAEEISSAYQKRAFDRLVVIAGPKMLGLIREALPDTDRAFIAAEIPKDLIRLDAEALSEHVPREAFQTMRTAAGSS